MLNSGNLMTSEVIPDNNPFSSIVIYIKNETLEKLLSNVEFPRKSNRPSPCQIFNQDDFIRHYARSLRLLLTSGPISSTVKWAKLLELFGYLGKVRTSIPRTKNENFSHLISMGYQ